METKKRDYYDVILDESAMGECTKADLDRFCELASVELEQMLQSDVRVRFGNGGDSYTCINIYNYTHQGPLTEDMKAAIEDVYQAGAWAAEEQSA